MEKKPQIDKKTITRSDLSAVVFRQLGVTHSEANELIDQVFKQITQAMTGGGEVKIPNFGTFTAKLRGRRIGRNPRTGEEIAIEPHIGVSFKSSPKFKTNIDDQMKKIKGIPKT